MVRILHSAVYCVIVTFKQELLIISNGIDFLSFENDFLRNETLLMMQGVTF